MVLKDLQSTTDVLGKWYLIYADHGLPPLVFPFRVRCPKREESSFGLERGEGGHEEERTTKGKPSSLKILITVRFGYFFDKNMVSPTNVSSLLNSPFSEKPSHLPEHN